jgi:hypothetical protein
LSQSTIPSGRPATPIVQLIDVRKSFGDFEVL